MEGMISANPAEESSQRGSTIILRNSLWMSLDTTLSFLLAFASSIAVARYLGPVKVGHYSYAVWLTSVAGALACYGIPTGARKYVAEYYGRGEPGLALAVLRYMLRLQLLLTLGLMCFTVTFVWVMSPAEMRVFHLLTCLSIAPQMA